MQSNLAETYDDEFTEEGPWKFEDAPEEVKQAILEKHRYWETEDNDWYEYTIDQFKENIAETGIEIHDVWFSGFYRQGDGASLDGGIESLEKFLTAYCKPEDFPAIRKLMTFDDWYFSFKSTSRDSNSMSIDYDYEDWRYLSIFNDLEPSDLRYIMLKTLNLLAQADDEIQDFAHHCEEIFKRKCREVFKKLEQEYEYLTSDECLIERFTDSDYMFDEDGDIV